MKKLPRTLILGGLITGLLIGAAVLSRFWTPMDPTGMNILNRLKPPGVGGILGADQIGRDVLSMLMAGAWTSLGIAGSATLIGGSIGTLIGVAAAARGGVFERVAMGLCGVLFAFPPILSAILLGALMGPGGLTAITAIGVFMVPVFARVTRGAALQIWARDYILAARMSGKGLARISLEHVIPNISAQIIVQLSIQTGLGILTEAGLSFLGMGMAPPTPSWGRMLADAQTYLSQAPHLVLAPGLAIALAVLGLNLLGDGLRDLTDPRRGQAT
jgi:peptide/nickel transport system permease protein